MVHPRKILFQASHKRVIYQHGSQQDHRKRERLGTTSGWGGVYPGSTRERDLARNMLGGLRVRSFKENENDNDNDIGKGGGGGARDRVIVVYFDLETTGLSKRVDQITQIGAVATRGWTSEAFSRFETYVKPLRPISEGSSRVTGITEETLVGAPSTMDSLACFLQWMRDLPGDDGGAVHLVAYNGLGYDFPILYFELERCGLDPARELLRNGVTTVVDPLVWGRRFLDQNQLRKNSRGRCSYRLGDVYRAFFGETITNAHNASADVNALHSLCVHPAYYEMVQACRKGEYGTRVDRHVKATLGRAPRPSSPQRTRLDATTSRKRARGCQDGSVRPNPLESGGSKRLRCEDGEDECGEEREGWREGEREDKEEKK